MACHPIIWIWFWIYHFQTQLVPKILKIILWKAAGPHWSLANISSGNGHYLNQYCVYICNEINYISLEYYKTVGCMLHHFVHNTAMENAKHKSVLEATTACIVYDRSSATRVCHHGLLVRHVKLRVAMPGTFSPPLRFSDPDMYHGTVVHVGISI